MSSALTVVETVASAVATARRARALHPRGRTFEATVRIFGLDGCGVDLLDRPGEYRALVRLSRGAGLPADWPDVLGVALRIYAAGGAGVDLDVLASTTVGRAPLARHVPMVRRRLATTYTTMAGYRTPRGRRYLAVLPDPAADDVGTDLSFLLAVAAPLGPWRVFGRLTLGQPVSARVDRMLAFDPVMFGIPGLRTDGLMWRVRAAAYRGSRKGRRPYMIEASFKSLLLLEGHLDHG